MEDREHDAQHDALFPITQLPITNYQLSRLISRLDTWRARLHQIEEELLGGIVLVPQKREACEESDGAVGQRLRLAVHAPGRNERRRIRVMTNAELVNGADVKRVVAFDEHTAEAEIPDEGGRGARRERRRYTVLDPHARRPPAFGAPRCGGAQRGATVSFHSAWC